MKTQLKILFSTIILLSCVKANEVVSNHDNGGRCTGSASCSACSNCTRCAHCSSGGTCGVCAGRSSGRSFYSAHSLKSSKKSKKYRSTNTLYSSRNSGNTKIVNSFYSSANKTSSKLKYATVVFAKNEVVNIRNHPKNNAEIIEKVKQNSKLVLLEKLENWYKVKVYKTGTVGFVESKFLKNKF